MDKIIKILIADDHTMFRESLKEVINSNKEFKVIDMASDGEIALAKIKQLKPDIAILDINMPKLTGIEVAKIIKTNLPDIKIIILTMMENELYILDAFKIQVEGFLYKDSKISDLVKAIKKVAKGKQFIPPDIKKRVMQFITSEKFGEQAEEKESNERIPLTPRQIEIIRYVAQGMTSRDVAEKLYLSELTVIKHRKNIIKKLGLKNFTEVVHFAHTKGII